MATEAQLKAISNNQLASGTEIPATKHRTVNDAIIEEIFNAQSRGDVLSGVQSAGALASGDLVFVIRSGEAYLLDSSEFGFIDTLTALTDTSITSPSNFQVLAFNSVSSKWENFDIASISFGLVSKTSGILTDGATVTINGSSKDQATFDWTANTASVSLVFSSGTAAQITSIFGKKTLAGDVTVTLDTTDYHFVDNDGADITSLTITNDSTTNKYFELSFLKSATFTESSKPVIKVLTSAI